MTNPRKKRKVTIYLDPEVEKSLAGFAARRDQSQSMIAEAAIASFLSPDDVERREAIIARRLDQLDRRMGRTERDVQQRIPLLRGVVQQGDQLAVIDVDHGCDADTLAPAATKAAARA